MVFLVVAFRLLSFYRPPSQATVKGIAEKVVKADLASWTINFSVEGNDFTVISPNFIKVRNQVVAFLEKQGFQRSEMIFSALDVTDRWNLSAVKKEDRSDNRFLVSGGVTVKSPQVDAFKTAKEEITSLLSAGIGLTTSPVNYYIQDFDALRPQMLSDALKSGLKMAAQMAEDIHMKLGRVITANQGSFSIENPETGNTWDHAGSLYKKIRLVSTFLFALK